MRGRDAMSAIRSRERESGGHVPIIALTAHAIDGDRERFLAAGADGYVSKPIAQSALLLEIDRVMTATAAWPPVTATA
jgi:CheY-like chemotaxis protein